MRTLKINHVAVWVMVIIYQVLSITWFSKALFANPWMAYLGKRFEDFDGESYSGILYSLSSAIAVCYLLALLFKKLQVSSGMRGLSTGLLAGFAFFLATLTQDTFSMRPMGLTLINSGIIIINCCIAGLVLGSWKKYATA